MEENGDIPPFWKPPATLTQRHRRRRSSSFLNSSLIIILLPSFILLSVVFIVIPWISSIILPHNNKAAINSSPQIQKSISVKKSWDSLNVVLVLFAILCGIFAKRNDDVPAAVEPEQVRHSNDNQRSTTTTHDEISSPTVLLHRSKSSIPQWFEYSQQQRITSPVNGNTSPVNGTANSRLRRTVSSDPYMRFTGNNQFRFFDDLDISRFYPKEDESQPNAEADEDDVVETSTVDEIPIDTFVLETRDELPSPTFSPPKTPPRDPPVPPPPPPPPPTKQRRTFQTLPRHERSPPSPPPPPPPPPQAPRVREEKKRSSRKRMNATKEIATALVSLYSHRKRKRRVKSSKIDEVSDSTPTETQSQLFPPQSPSPPPPPPPPPPSVFQNWFKKGSKSKKIHSLSSIPPPPHPKPVNSAGKPPLPRRREIRNESPMNGIPSPPPPPPFKVAGMKFPVVGGGYVNVRVQGASGSPEMDGEDDATSTSSELNGKDGERSSSVTCPSPDVNTKADTFIARHHDGWRLEKLNSWREKVNKAGNGSTSSSRPIF